MLVNSAPDPSSATSIASNWLKSFDHACSDLSQVDTEMDTLLDPILAHFLPNGWWRDALCLSWDYRTHEGISSIHVFLKDSNRLAKAGLYNFQIDVDSALGGPVLRQVLYEQAMMHHVVEFSFRFDVTYPPGRGRAIVRLLRELNPGEIEDQWKAYTLYTTLESITGHEPPEHPPYGHYEGQKA